MKSACLLLSLLILSGGKSISARQRRSISDPLARSTQLLVVTTSSWDAVDGHLQLYERTNSHDRWQPVGESIPIVVGKHGMAWGVGVATPEDLQPQDTSDPVKQEGDGRSPAGIFTLGTTFGYSPQLSSPWKMPYLPLTSSTECVDDIASTHYNRIVERPPASSNTTPDWNSSEHMRSAGESYRWGIVVDHNGTAANPGDPPPVSGRGSCIFLHVWSGAGRGTAGCTAMPQKDLEGILARLDPQRAPMLVQLPAQQYARFLQRWKLPTTINLSH